MNNRARLTIAFISVLLLLAISGTQFVNLGDANPYFDGGTVPPDPSAKPPHISIFAPQNNTVYAADTIPLSINVSFPESQKAGTVLDLVYYETDWQENRTYLYASGVASFDDRIALSKKMYFQYTKNLTGIPDGNHTIRVSAEGGGSYIENWYRYSFPMSASSSISFAIDTVPPKVVLSIENKTYYTPDIPLSFTVNEPNTQVIYSLDGRENVTVAGNTTLTDLSIGEHNVTVYALDKGGNMGASETMYFSVEEPFPVAPVATASLATVAVLGVGLLFYFKKRKH